MRDNKIEFAPISERPPETSKWRLEYLLEKIDKAHLYLETQEENPSITATLWKRTLQEEFKNYDVSANYRHPMYSTLKEVMKNLPFSGDPIFYICYVLICLGREATISRSFVVRIYKVLTGRDLNDIAIDFVIWGLGMQPLTRENGLRRSPSTPGSKMIESEVEIEEPMVDPESIDWEEDVPMRIRRNKRWERFPRLPADKEWARGVSWEHLVRLERSSDVAEAYRRMAAAEAHLIYKLVESRSVFSGVRYTSGLLKGDPHAFLSLIFQSMPDKNPPSIPVLRMKTLCFAITGVEVSEKDIHLVAWLEGFPNLLS